MCDVNFIAFIARDGGGEARASERVDGIVSVTGATVQRIDPRGVLTRPARRVPRDAMRDARARHWCLDRLTVYSFLSLAQRKDWLALVAVHSDAWLMAVAFYYGAKFDAKKRYVSHWWFGGS
jgi:hypothetical protein